VAWGFNNNGQCSVPDPNTGFVVAVAGGRGHSLGLKACIGDLDSDGARSLADLSILLSHFGVASGATYRDGDLDNDHDVDLSDLTRMLANFGTTCP
jgi:hypothetical protein